MEETILGSLSRRKRCIRRSTAFQTICPPVLMQGIHSSRICAVLRWTRSFWSRGKNICGVDLPPCLVHVMLRGVQDEGEKTSSQIEGWDEKSASLYVIGASTLSPNTSFSSLCLTLQFLFYLLRLMVVGRGDERISPSSLSFP